MPFFYSKPFGGRRAGGTMRADRHDLLRIGGFHSIMEWRLIHGATMDRGVSEWREGMGEMMVGDAGYLCKEMRYDILAFGLGCGVCMVFIFPD
ncbi:hypothetical protein WAI453_000708 [Rhynchosporium graminicola]